MALKSLKEKINSVFAVFTRDKQQKKDLSEKTQDSIVLHTEVDGKEYDMTIPMSDVREAFGKAMNAAGVLM